MLKSPSPGLQLNAARWTHTNMVVGSVGEDKKISLWNKNMQALSVVPQPSRDVGYISSLEGMYNGNQFQHQKLLIFVFRWHWENCQDMGHAAEKMHQVVEGSYRHYNWCNVQLQR